MVPKPASKAGDWLGKAKAFGPKTVDGVAVLPDLVSVALVVVADGMEEGKPANQFMSAACVWLLEVATLVPLVAVESWRWVLVELNCCCCSEGSTAGLYGRRFGPASRNADAFL